MHGARTTRTLSPRAAGSDSSRARAPPSSQEILSQTRTVIGGGGSSPSVENVEVRIERRDLVDLGHRQAHLVGEGGEMGGGDAVPSVLNQMQMLDEQVAVAGAVPEQLADLVESGLDRPAAPWAGDALLPRPEPG